MCQGENARGPTTRPHRPRPYDVRAAVASSHSRDGGWVDGWWGPLWASVPHQHHANINGVYMILSLWSSVPHQHHANINGVYMILSLWASVSHHHHVILH